MTKLNIPERFRPAFKKLRDLPDAAFEELVRAARAAKPHVYSEIFVSSLEGSAPGIAAPDMREIMNAVIGASAARLSVRDSIPTFVDSFVGSGDIELGDDPERLTRRLTQILEIESVRTTSKAMDLVIADEKPYGSSSLVTDVRPLFADAIGPQISAAVLVHLLKIAYYVQGTEPGSITIAMDDRDLAELKATIDRAEQESEALRTLLAQWAVSYIESREDT